MCIFSKRQCYLSYQIQIILLYLQRTLLHVSSETWWILNVFLKNIRILFFLF
ncbi:hypothetical protein Patl1_26225 [Pistacia atlantica]|uniref:Uncharacterized protein n=1 Tax=Pistacia atlantica TaxID=434234 RepID=A0ACC1B4Q3_9ROSI|nr:hypothetical protein Patl1_26225 [Pistacia atlantica]